MRRGLKLALLLLIVINVVYVFSGVVVYGMRSVDAYAIWIYKAKLFYYSNESILEVLSSFRRSHPQYPILLPYIFYQVFLAAGQVKEIYVLLIYPFVYVFILLISYNLFRKLDIPDILSLAFVYVYSMFSPLLLQAGRGGAGIADIIIVLLWWLALYYAHQVYKGNRIKHLLVLTLLVMTASQIKLEGLLIIWLIVFLDIDIKKKMSFLFIAVVPNMIWILLVYTYSFYIDIGYHLWNVGELLQRISIIVSYTFRQMLNVYNWYFYWIIFWMAIVIKKVKLKFVGKLLRNTLLAVALSFFIHYLYTSLKIEPYIRNSMDRVLFQMSPIFFTIFAYKLHLIIKHKLASHY